MSTINKIFNEIGKRIGQKLVYFWNGQDIDLVCEAWATDLQEFSLGGMRYAFKQWIELDRAISAGEFKKLCNEYRPQESLQLDCKLTPSQLEKNRERIAQMVAMLAKSKTVNS